MNNNLLKDKLSIIVNDDILMQAIRIIFNKRIEKEKPEIQKTDDNIVLGEKYRAYEKAKEMIDEAFIDLMSYKKEYKKKEEFNKEL